MTCRTFIAAIISVLVLTTSPALAEPIGNAVRIVNKVTGSLEQSRRDISVGDGVNQNEAIEVATDALGELKLNDDSKIALGPGARLVLDTFVYDPSRSNGAVSVNLAKGAFRFITGLSRKQDYKLRTPSASIAVRGTVFDVYVDANGDTWLLLLEGSVQVCNTSGQCTDVTNPCGVVRIPATGAFDGPQGWPVQSRQVNFDTAFPFVGTPPSIDAKPLFTRAAVELNQCTAKKPNLQEAKSTAPSDTSDPPPESYTSPSRPGYAEVRTSRSTSDTPPIVPRRNFSGAYIGLVAGAAWHRPDPFLDCYDYTNSNPRECSTYLPFAIPANVFELNDTGFLGGGQIGYNVALGNVVVGLEADISYANIDATEVYVQPFICCTRDTTLRQELSSLSTVRGRLGYTFDNILVYATGGLAIGKLEYAFDLFDPSLLPGDGTANDAKSKLAVGYTVGAGIEVSLGRLSLKTEYLFYDLGEQSLTAPFYVGGAVEPFTFRPEFDTQGHILRIGTNFHLN